MVKKHIIKTNLLKNEDDNFKNKAKNLKVENKNNIDKFTSDSY